MKRANKFIKNSFICILSFFLAFGTSIDAMAEEIADDGLYHISTPDDWNAFASSCRLDSWSDGIAAVLDNDIDVKGCETVPTFGGSFDGRGHTIKGLAVNDEGDVQGLFRYVREGAVIKNLNVEGIVFPSGSSQKAGLLAGENRGNIINCNVKGIVTAASSAGGIAGVNKKEGRIESCSMEAGAVSGERYCAGIAGENYGSITDSLNRADINTRSEDFPKKINGFDTKRITSTENVPAAQDSGGIAGFSDGLIFKCTNYGSVGHPHWGYNMGGIAGRQSGLVSQCENFGLIEGRKDIGGIAGQAEPYTELQYQKSTLQKLADELDKLGDIINSAFENTDDTRESISRHINNIADYVDGAEDNISDILDGIADMGDESIDTVNDLSVRINDFIKDTVRTSDSLQKAGEKFADSLKAVDDLFQNVIDGSVSDEGAKEEMREALDDLEGMIGDIIATIPVPLGNDTMSLPTEDAEEIIGEKAEEFFDILEYIKNDFSIAVGRLQKAAEHLKASGELSKETEKSLFEALNNLKSAANSLSKAGSHIGNAFLSLKEAIENQSELPPLILPSIPDSYHEDKKHLHSNLNYLIDEMEKLNDIANAGGDVLSDDLKKINDEIDVIADILRSSGKNDEDDDLFVDISEEDAAGATWGKIEKCQNEGSIEGDVNIGGIAGAMAIEYDFDPEDDVTKNGEKSIDFKYYTRAIIHSCQNKADIISKKDCVGGIVGRMDLGAVLACRSFGDIESTSGEKIGGIAGFSDGIIKDCRSKCRLEGTRKIGGIAGEGHDIKYCRSISQIDDEAHFTGAVAGCADGDILGNIFLMSYPGGIDNISYKGKAEPVSYEEIIDEENAPPEFKEQVVTFIADDKVVSSMTVNYKDCIPESKMPKVPEKEGCYGRWEDFESSSVTFNQEVEAVYTPWLTAVPNDDGSILAEGRFKPGVKLKTESLSMTPPVKEEYDLGIYKVSLPKDEKFTALRFKMPKDNCQLWLLNDDGSWKQLLTEEKDSFIRCSLDGSEAVICLAYEKSYTGLFFLSAFAVLSFFIIVKLIKRKKKSKE